MSAYPKLDRLLAAGADAIERAKTAEERAAIVLEYRVALGSASLQERWRWYFGWGPSLAAIRREERALRALQEFERVIEELRASYPTQPGATGAPEGERE